MLEHMKNTLFKSLLIPVALYAFTAAAGLYKGLDEEGNVIYSDKPFENSQQFTPPPITVMDAPRVQPKEEAVEETSDVEFKYTKFSILAPKNDEVIWNNPQLVVALKVIPALNIAEGHRTWLLMDGKPLVKNSQSLFLQIGRADRGEHQLQAQIRNKKGRIIKRTKTVTVHIKNTVIRKQAR
ncbi:MAG: hypothetical protein ACNYZG_02590 [Gammaproteobacteria bacterium]